MKKRSVGEESPEGEFWTENDTQELELEAEEASFQTKIADLRERLKASEKESQTNLDGWQRSRADYLNLKKRSEEELRELKGRVERSSIEKILPLADSLELALKSMSSHGGPLEQGFLNIKSQFDAILKSFSVETIDPTGEVYDPLFHEALTERTVKNGEVAGTVVEVIQKGYRLKEVLIRPARVIIGTS